MKLVKSTLIEQPQAIFGENLFCYYGISLCCPGWLNHQNLSDPSLASVSHVSRTADGISLFLPSEHNGNDVNYVITVLQTSEKGICPCCYFGSSKLSANMKTDDGGLDWALVRQHHPIGKLFPYRHLHWHKHMRVHTCVYARFFETGTHTVG